MKSIQNKTHKRLPPPKKNENNKLSYGWFGLVLWHFNPCWLFNVKSSLYIHIKYMICKHILLMFLNEPKLHTVKYLQVLLCITNSSINTIN